MFTACGKYSGLFLFLFIIVSLPTSRISFAQNIPSPAEPGRIPQHFEERVLTRPQLELSIPDTGPEQKAPKGADTVTFTLKDIVFEGVSAYSLESFSPLYETKLGQNVTLSFLFEIANQITSKYRNDGYILSRAIVPEQRIKGGTAKIRIVEGRVNNTIIIGGSEKARRLIDKYGKKIVEQAPLHISTLERYLLLMRDLPGHHVETLLRPAEKGIGTAELVLNVSYKTFEAAIGTSNRGTEFLGPVQNTMRAQGNSLLTAGDQSVLRYISTGTGIPFNQQELRSFDIRHRQIIGTEGTSVGFAAIDSLSFPGNSLEALEAKTRNELLSFDVRHPFIRSRRMNIFGGMQFDYQNAETELLGLITANDRIRSMRINGSFDFADEWRGITQIYGEVSQGLNILNNSSDSSTTISRVSGRSDYSKINFEISRLQNVRGPVNLYASVAGQYSPHRLLSAEEFGVGGSNYGRGYDPSEITGDRGIAAKLELQYSDTIKLPALESYQLYAFYDFGKVWQTEDVTGGSASLASTGIGARANVTDWLTGTLEAAKPLTRAVSTADTDEGTDPRVFFSLTARY
jgi:hemolysin activation/secretion protein